MPERVLAGRYELREQIGSGGMAVVYKAWDIRRRRHVAVKMLRAELAKLPGYVNRFENEAHNMLKMQHANITRIYGLGCDGEIHYMVMELVEGRTLKEQITSVGKIKPAEAVSVAVSVLSAMYHAHKRHMIHRDIKPQNILISKNGAVKVIDFGIAKSILPEENLISVSDQDKAPHNALGSVHYFSPEQAQGLPATEKSDLYSVGVVLYEMLCGAVPYDGMDAETVARQHISGNAVSPHDRDESIPEKLSDAVMKAIDKDPEKRYGNAAEMANELRRAVIEQKKIEQPDPAKRKKHIMLCVYAVLSIILVTSVSLLVRGVIRNMPYSCEMPNVCGMQLEEAIELLNEEDIPYQIEEDEESAKAPGEIVYQEPSEGMYLRKGESLVIRISLGEHASYVQNILGMPLEEAEQTLQDSELQIGDVTEILSDEPAGTVLTQCPAPGDYTENGTEVDVTVSAVSSMLPDMRGIPLESALELIDQLGLKVGSIEYSFSDDEQDTVLSQSVPENTRVFAGESVDLVVSKLDPDKAFKCEIKLMTGDIDPDTEIVIELVSGEIHRVYEETAGYAGLDPEITIYSSIGGEQYIRIYLDGTLVSEKSVCFR